MAILVCEFFRPARHQDLGLPIQSELTVFLAVEAMHHEDLHCEESLELTAVDPTTKLRIPLLPEVTLLDR